MSRFELLTQFLQNQPGNEVRLSFAQIEQIIGGPLPAAAQAEQDWWSNAPTSEANAWRAAGFRSEAVDLAAGELTFRRNGDAADAGPVTQAEHDRHPIFGWAKGMITITPGTDLTAPADPDLADWADRKYGPPAR